MASLRTQHRREAKKREYRKTVLLNLVSLTDFFTILVVFLLVHTSAPELLERLPDVTPPNSTSQQAPEDRIVISVNKDAIAVQGKTVAEVADLAKNPSDVIVGLQKALQLEGARMGDVPDGGRKVTIMGDRALPYVALKRIMLTCQATDFAKISLAVNRLDVKPTNAEVEAAKAVAAAPSATAQATAQGGAS